MARRPWRPIGVAVVSAFTAVTLCAAATAAADLPAAAGQTIQEGRSALAAARQAASHDDPRLLRRLDRVEFELERAAADRDQGDDAGALKHARRAARLVALAARPSQKGGK